MLQHDRDEPPPFQMSRPYLFASCTIERDNRTFDADEYQVRGFHAIERIDARGGIQLQRLSTIVFPSTRDNERRELSAIMGWDPRLEAGEIALVVALDHLADFVQARDHGRVSVRHQEIHEVARRAQLRSQFLDQFPDSVAGSTGLSADNSINRSNFAKGGSAPRPRIVYLRGVFLGHGQCGRRCLAPRGIGSGAARKISRHSRSVVLGEWIGLGDGA